VGEYAVNLMRERLDLEIPVDEAGNIAFHFINAQFNHPYNSQNLLISRTLDAVLDIVKYAFGITYNEEKHFLFPLCNPCAPVRPASGEPQSAAG